MINHRYWVIPFFIALITFGTIGVYYIRPHPLNEVVSIDQEYNALVSLANEVLTNTTAKACLGLFTQSQNTRHRYDTEPVINTALTKCITNKSLRV